MTTLKHLDEFSSILANYQPSDEAQTLLAQAPLVLLVGITSAGRNAIISNLLETGDYYYIISDTTRSPRRNNGNLEHNGREYWFRTEAEVLTGLKSGKYLEAAIIHSQQVSGISVSELEAARSQQKIAIDEIEVVGVDNLVRIAPKMVIPIFVLPPSYDVWIQRWTKRGQQSPEDTRNRMHSAQKELSMALKKNYYHFLVNDDLSKAVAGVQKIIAGQIDPIHEAEGRAVAKELLDSITQASS